MTTTRTRIKVCGMREAAEVAGVVAAGVDALGFIFVDQSPRAIDPEQARKIIRTLPPFVDAVGVFVNEEASVANEIVQYCGLTMVQLHGEEPPDLCGNISCRVIKAFRIGPDSTAGDLAPYGGMVSAFLLDTYHEKLAGGTGQTFDWQRIASLTPPGPLILSGGLGPDNVGKAVREVRPFAVDVNSGVELAPGRKDVGKVEQVVNEVGKADASAPAR